MLIIKPKGHSRVSDCAFISKGRVCNEGAAEDEGQRAEPPSRDTGLDLSPASVITRTHAYSHTQVCTKEKDIVCSEEDDKSQPSKSSCRMCMNTRMQITLEGNEAAFSSGGKWSRNWSQCWTNFCLSNALTEWITFVGRWVRLQCKYSSSTLNFHTLQVQTFVSC